MTEPVQPFSLDLVYIRHAPLLSKVGGNARGKRPNLFGKFDNCLANDLEYMHEIIRSQITVRVLRV